MTLNGCAYQRGESFFYISLPPVNISIISQIPMESGKWWWKGGKKDKFESSCGENDGK